MMKKNLIALIATLFFSTNLIANVLDKESSMTTSKQQSGQLLRCSDKPNCVCSQYPDDEAHFIEPLLVNGDIAPAWVKIKVAINKMGGQIVDESEVHIDAVFISKVFRFRDDVTLVRDNETQTIHVRSASRMGRSDFGVNRKRVERIRALIQSEN